MSGLETIVEFGCLSDEQRWNAGRYDFAWLPELDAHDRGIVKLLDCLADGEFSGQASSAQLYELMVREVDNGYPRELQYDWAEIYAYANIIVYEESRHGFSLGLLNYYVDTGRTDFIKRLSVREYGRKYVWCYDDRRYWDLYSYILAHLFGEVVNTELYRDIRAKVHHPELRQIITNVMTDEARHTRAWANLIGNLIRSDPRHEERALKTLTKGLLFHNAMVHETYFEGQNKMLKLFSSAQGGKAGAIERIVKIKHNLLDELFGADKNPLSEAEIKKIHMEFLASSFGETRAVAGPNGTIKFLKQEEDAPVLAEAV
ncbi:MAG: hypothetical protein C3F11_16425 [Methylocystaceae bacterium]|nr:MAG: hypothetical protein C3F11_16425 [Methylocystaceae bacterium]